MSKKKKTKAYSSPKGKSPLAKSAPKAPAELNPDVAFAVEAAQAEAKRSDNSNIIIDGMSRAETADRDQGKRSRRPLTVLMYSLIFCLSAVYTEVVLSLLVFGTLKSRIVFPILFAAALGAAAALIMSFVPGRVRRVAAPIIVAVPVVYSEIQLVYHAIFGSIMPLNLMRMGTGVVTNFGAQIEFGVKKNILGILILLVPLILSVAAVIVFRRLAKERLSGRNRVVHAIILAAAVAALVAVLLPGRGVFGSAYETFSDPNVVADTSYKNIGMFATVAQEIRYMIFGSDEAGVRLYNTDEIDPDGYDSGRYNVIDTLDFDKLASSTDDEALKNLDEYFTNVAPTKKNLYTGMFEGYNVVEFCAESFSPYFIDPELTPTLYKMTNHGFIFNNYYGSFQSVTTDGEYTMSMGNFPDFSRTKVSSSFDVSADNYLPFCLGNALGERGYAAYAYHNYLGSFYNRTITHPNMGYDFKSVGYGLDMEIQWPSSDKEMIEKSIDDYIDSQPFVAYYMTFSGHYQYNWHNEMSAKNRAVVESLPQYHTEAVQSFVACNLEVEYALTYLMERLEEKGIADKTLIVLTNDHYPYGLSEEEYNELKGEPVDTVFERYRNSFICYCEGMKDITVDAYCSTQDILPTVLNLLGVPYDSRLLAGRDALSNCEHIAILADGSFITENMRYDAESNEAYASDGGDVDEGLFNHLNFVVQNRFTVSREILYSDYYAHAFGRRSSASPDKVDSTARFKDIENIFDQAYITMMVEQGFADPVSEDEFGAALKATIGEYLDMVYRVMGRPEPEDDTVLPEAYADESSPRYDAYKWAFSVGLLDADEEFTPDSPENGLELQTGARLVYRTAHLMGITTWVDEAAAAKNAEENPQLDEELIYAIRWCLGSETFFGETGTFTEMWRGADSTDENAEPAVVDRLKMTLSVFKLYKTVN